MGDESSSLGGRRESQSPLTGPPINPHFLQALDQLVSLAKQGQKPDSENFNPSDKWLTARMPIFQDLPLARQQEVLDEVRQLDREAQEANSVGRAATRVWPHLVQSPRNHVA